MKWTMIASAGVALLLFILWVISPSSYDSTPLTNRLLAAGSEPTPFTKAMPDHDWDIVCYSTQPYTSPSQRLWLLFGKENVRNLAYEPFDQSIGEAEISILFIDFDTDVVHVYVLSKDNIVDVSGPYCIDVDRAFFKLEIVNSLDGSYTNLILISIN